MEHPQGSVAGAAEGMWPGSAIQGLSVAMQQPRETPAQMRDRREKEREQQDMAEALRRRIQAQSDAEMRWARAHGFDYPGGEVVFEKQLDVTDKEASLRERDLRAQELLWMPISQTEEMEREQLQLREMQLKRQQWEMERDARLQATFEWVKEKEREKERDKEREREQERMEDLDDDSVVSICTSKSLLRYHHLSKLFTLFLSPCAACSQVDSVDFDGAVAFSIALVGDLASLRGLFHDIYSLPSVADQCLVRSFLLHH